MNDYVEVLTIENDQDFVSNIFRFRKGCKVRFMIGGSLQGKKVNLFINHPEEGKSFERSQFRKLKWKHKKESKIFHADLIFHLPGSFRYYFTEESEAEILGSGFCLVLPELSLPDGTVLAVDSIECLSVASHQLGKLETWMERLEMATKYKCNMLHFTPIQQLSRLPYLIEDHFRVSHKLGANPEPSIEDVKRLLAAVKEANNVLCITDVILTNVAKNAGWIQKHPEAIINLKNSPHLRPAYLLDRVLRYLSLDIIKGKYNGIGLSKDIKEGHLNKIRVLIKETYLREARIYELFLINVDSMVKQYKESLESAIKSKKKPVFSQPESQQLPIVQDPQYRRKSSTVDISYFVAQTLNDESQDSDLSPDLLNACAAAFKEQLEQLNYKIMNDSVQELSDAVDNVLEHIRQTRINNQGPPLSKDFPLVPSYFVHPGKEVDVKTDEKLINDEKHAQLIMAHHGIPVEKENADDERVSKSNPYLRRELVIDQDAVSLYLNDIGKESTFIHNYVHAYLMQMIDTFDGIVIRNLRSCPAEVVVHLVDLARKLKPNIYIVGELSRLPNLEENVSVNLLGLNAVVRCSSTCTTVEELGKLIRRLEQEMTAAGNRRSYIAPAMLFDQQPKSLPLLQPSAAHRFSLTAATAMARSAICLMHNSDYETKYADTYANSCMLSIMKYLNELHLYLSKGFCEVYVDVVNSNVIAISRHNPVVHKSIVLMCRTGFTATERQDEEDIEAFLTVPGRINRIMFEVETNEEYDTKLSFKLRYDIPLKDTKMVTSSKIDGENQVEFVNFKTGSLIVLDVSVHAPTKRKSSDINENVARHVKLDTTS